MRASASRRPSVPDSGSDSSSGTGPGSIPGEARAQVLDWLARGRLEPQRVPAALALLAPAPDGAAWRRLLATLGLALGALLLAVGVIFFFAYNWSGLGRLGKLALVQSALLLAVGVARWRGLDAPAGRAALLAATLLVGAALAVFGQVYQTGADPWQLFALWAAIITPWALAGREPWLWLLWIALLDLALVLRLALGPAWLPFAFSPFVVLWSVFAANGLALLAWEWLAQSALPWLRAPWARRLLVLGAGVPLTALFCLSVLGGPVGPVGPDGPSGSDGPAGLSAALAWLLSMGALYARFRHVRPDLFVLAAGVLATIVVATVVLSRFVASGLPLAGGLLLIVVAIVGLAAAGASWLRGVALELDGERR